MNLQQLIQEHKIRKQEVFSLLEELSQVDFSKLKKEDKKGLEISKTVLEMEYQLRSSFINELEDLE